MRRGGVLLRMLVDHGAKKSVAAGRDELSGGRDGLARIVLDQIGNSRSEVVILSISDGPLRLLLRRAPRQGISGAVLHPVVFFAFLGG